MLIAIADTPEEFRAELLKMLDWRIQNAVGDSRRASKVRDRHAAFRVHAALSNFKDDMMRTAIVSKAEMLTLKGPTNDESGETVDGEHQGSGGTDIPTAHKTTSLD